MTTDDLHALIDEWQAAATEAQAGRSAESWRVPGRLYVRLMRGLAAHGPLEHRGEIWEAVVSGVRVTKIRPAGREAAGG